MEKRTIYWLSVIFLVTLILRLTLALSISNFTYQSYFTLRQVDHIASSGLPFYQDPLSYGGRENIFLPLFYYVAAFFDLFLPLEFVAHVLPNLLFSTLTILAYALAKKITKDDTASLFSAFIAGFLPILFTPNSFTFRSLFFPLLMLVIYAFLNLQEKKYFYLYLVSFVLLCFTSPAAFLLIIGFGVYLLLSSLERKKVARAELELMLFSLFFFTWSQFLFFKNTLIHDGIGFIWKNIPPQIISQYFPQVSVPKAILLVSIVAFIAGIVVAYRSLFRLKNQNSLFLISLVISIILLGWFRLVEFRFGLSLFGLILAVLFASYYKESAAYLQRTKLPRFQRMYLPLLVILLVLSTVWPAITTATKQETPSENSIAAFTWLKDHAEEDVAVLALLEEGHLVTVVSQRKNIMDDQFGLVPDVEQRFADLETLYTTSFQTEALALLDKYNVKYLVLTPDARHRYQLATFKYFDDKCFDRAYSNRETKIYRVKCTLREAS